MNKIIKIKTLIAIVSCLMALFSFSGCDFGSGREYYDDICIPIETQEGKIVIKEWSFLMGSGAEVYYKNGRKEILLGRLIEADDGYCAFKNGKYSVTFDDNNVTIKWCQMLDSGEHWETETFELPLN